MIAIDDKVKLKGHDVIMTVLRFERNDYPSKPDNVLCGWIGRSEAWQTAEFAPASLEVVPVPEDEIPIPVDIGDVVVLMSGNVLMTVTNVSDEGAECTWFDDRDMIHSRTFPFIVLAFAPE